MAGMKAGLVALVLFALGACAAPQTVPMPPALSAGPGVQRSPEAAAESFVDVVMRVQPVAEALCRERTRNVDCRFQIAVDDRPNQPPNAFQTVDDRGRPILAFNVALIAEARNADELAFVMGHEAAHHIAGHIPRAQEGALAGAIVAGTLASLGGADAAAVQAAQDIGAQLGSRSYSKQFELEADALGTEIAWAAGFDPVLGAEFFRRLPDPGNRFLGSHPPNAERMAVVRATAASLR